MKRNLQEEKPLDWEDSFDKLFNPATLKLRVGKYYFKDEKKQIKDFIRNLLEKEKRYYGLSVCEYEMIINKERNRILEIINGMNMETSAIYPYLAYNRALEDIKSKLK